MNSTIIDVNGYLHEHSHFNGRWNDRQIEKAALQIFANKTNQSIDDEQTKNFNYKWLWQNLYNFFIFFRNHSFVIYERLNCKWTRQPWSSWIVRSACTCTYVPFKGEWSAKRRQHQIRHDAPSVASSSRSVARNETGDIVEVNISITTSVVVWWAFFFSFHNSHIREHSMFEQIQSATTSTRHLTTVETLRRPLLFCLGLRGYPFKWLRPWWQLHRYDRSN